jgi:F-type H+-transporting ATPase subunit b
MKKFAFALASLSLSSAALAAPESGEKAGVLPTMLQGLVPMIVSLVVFGLVFAILAVKVWPVIVKALNERESKIRSEIESAEMARQQAKAALDQYERALAEARAEAQRELEKAKSLQAAQLAELKAKNDVAIAMERDKAMREIDASKKLAIQEIYAQGAALSTAVAGRILQRELNPADYQRLVDEAVAGLGVSKN